MSGRLGGAEYPARSGGRRSGGPTSHRARNRRRGHRAAAVGGCSRSEPYPGRRRSGRVPGTSPEAYRGESQSGPRGTPWPWASGRPPCWGPPADARPARDAAWRSPRPRRPPPQSCTTRVSPPSSSRACSTSRTPGRRSGSQGYNHTVNRRVCPSSPQPMWSGTMPVRYEERSPFDSKPAVVER